MPSCHISTLKIGEQVRAVDEIPNKHRVNLSHSARCSELIDLLTIVTCLLKRSVFELYPSSQTCEFLLMVGLCVRQEYGQDTIHPSHHHTLISKTILYPRPVVLAPDALKLGRFIPR